MARGIAGAEVLRPFLLAAVVAFLVSFLVHLGIRWVEPVLSETAQWLLLGSMFLASFAATRLLARRRRSAA